MGKWVPSRPSPSPTNAHVYLVLQLPTLVLQDEVCHVIRGKMEQFEHNSSSYPRQHHYLQPTGSSAQDISGQLDLESDQKKKVNLCSTSMSRLHQG